MGRPRSDCEPVVVSRGLHRGLYCSLFDDPDFQLLPPPARHVLLTVRLCAQNNASSMFRYYPALLCVQTGLGPRTLESAFRALEAGRWIEREDGVVWIRNGLRYDPNIRLADPKHRTGVDRAIAALPKLPIVLRFCDYYRITRPFQDPPETIPRPGTLSPPSSTPIPIPNPRTTESTASPRGVDPPPPPEPASPSWGTPEALVALYNRLVPPGHPRVTRLTPKRREKARRYLAAFPEQTFWTGAFTAIRVSEFLQGRRNGREHTTFRGDFDWLLSVGKDGTENAVKAEEGKYADG